MCIKLSSQNTQFELKQHCNSSQSEYVKLDDGGGANRIVSELTLRTGRFKTYTQFNVDVNTLKQ